ncbi:MAG: Spi family protease inhibitor [Bacteroidaceae bacterium]|nr:Spi family protease inhibitor [Bacteroidaceae bacterium]
MKKNIFIFVVVAVFVACSQDSLNDFDFEAYSSQTRSDGLKGINWKDLDTINFVSEKDMDSYIHFKKLLAKSSKEEISVKSIEPLTLEENAVLGYLVNYDKGWEIVAADKRCPTVIAKGEEGNFSMNEIPENMKAWTESLLYDVASMRSMQELPNNLNEETLKNINSSINFWKAITCDFDFLENPDGSPQMDMLTPLLPPPGSGHWVLAYVDSSTVEISELHHLISTQWGQTSHFNGFYPQISITNSNRPSAGCAIIAIAQELYYLHNKLGHPNGGPITARYSGYVDNYETALEEADYSPLWENVEFSNYWKSTFAAWLAIISNASFNPSSNGNYIAGLNLDQIVSCFTHVNIDTEAQAYNSNVVMNNLQDSLPVIVGLYDFTTNPPGGHAAIIDAYRITRTDYFYNYLWVYNTPSSDEMQGKYTRTAIESGTPVTQFRLNWGWEGYYNDNLYYTYGIWNAGYNFGTIQKMTVSDFAVN